MPPSTAILETERLRLRPRVAADLEACLAMDMDPDVGRYLYPHGRPTKAEPRPGVRAWRARRRRGCWRTASRT
jgi:RimJ/RimL family protein N-acetyltransferase